jgi:hypothetical protein
VPAESFHAVAAVVMVALAGLAAALATWGFDRRDLAGPWDECRYTNRVAQ